MITTLKTIPTAAACAYLDRKFKYRASFLYFLDIKERLLALLSRSEKKFNKIRHEVGLLGNASHLK